MTDTEPPPQDRSWLFFDDMWGNTYDHLGRRLVKGDKPNQALRVIL